MTGSHHHPEVHKSEVVFFHVQNEIKNKARNSTGPLKQMFESTISKAIRENGVDIEQAAIYTPTYRASQKHLYKLRKENLPPLPKETSEINFEEEYLKFTETNCNSRFLLFDTKDSKRIIAFASDIQFQILSQSKRWHIDGTFKAAPSLYKQLYQIHAWDFEEMHACVFIFLLNKTEEIYIKMIDFLISASSSLGFILKPDTVVSDFESAAINAFSKKFPEAEIKGCHFHFTQAIWKNIRSIGLTNDFKNKREISEWLNYFKSLPFVPIDQIQKVLKEIMNVIPNKSQDKLLEFLNYFERTWINHFVFTPLLWNHFETKGPRTNNHVEGFNHKINNYIDNNHPHVYSAINTLKCLETTVSLNFFKRKNGEITQVPRRPKDIQRDEMLEYLKNKMLQQNLSFISYMKRISDLFSFDKDHTKIKIRAPVTKERDETLPSLSIFKISKQSFNFIKSYVIENRERLIELTKNLRKFNAIVYYNGQAYETDHYPVLYKWYMSNVVTIKTTADGNCLYHAISTSISGKENLWKDIKLGMIFMFFEYEDYFRKLANAMGLEASFELLIESSAIIGVFGRSFNILSLSLLFLRPINIFETSNLSFISDVPCLNTVPIYLSLNNAHFTSIVP
ncbi:unnamed protein product [Brachionus calyciflorus]|uniref:OTU domain-containing protein n=1 Tax=Brachionus calyciflorus TaxID=104777 RepID=A0A814ASC8_9BILA|nr:unnamed protein product [Brachionus calyciflorus]